MAKKLVSLSSFIVFVLMVAAPVASCYGVQTGVQRALGTYEEWVYEECYDYADRITKCAPLDEPRKEERTVAGADIWAGMAALILVGVVVSRAGVGFVELLERRLGVIGIGQREGWRTGT